MGVGLPRLKLRLYEQDCLFKKDPKVSDYVKSGLKYVKDKVWPRMKRLKRGYDRYKLPDDIFVWENAPPHTPAMTLTIYNKLKIPIKKYLLVSKRIMKYPVDLFRKYILAHEEIGHISNDVEGDFRSEVGLDLDLIDANLQVGDYRTAREIERSSGYVQKLYGLVRGIFSRIPYISRNLK